jgi:hypothetical protein
MDPGRAVTVIDDLKAALTLSSAFALAAIATVPMLLPALPPEAQQLPLPLPVFCAFLALQLTIVYGLLGLAGCRLARSRGLDPAPVLTQFWTRQRNRTSPNGFRSIRVAVISGLICGVCLVGAVSLIQSMFPGTLPPTLHPPGLLTAAVASAAGSLGEEILFRLFMLSLFLQILPMGRTRAAVAVAASALAFGAAHAPAFVFLFGGWDVVPPIAWVWLVALNGLCGVTYGIVYLQFGIESAIAAHFATDAVWHAASQLSSG